MDLSIIESVIFTAPSCVKNFKKVYGCIPERAEIIATGRITKEAAEPATLNSRPDCLQQKI
jgi:uroporphyrinogen-III synthase